MAFGLDWIREKLSVDKAFGLITDNPISRDIGNVVGATVNAVFQLMGNTWEAGKRGVNDHEYVRGFREKKDAFFTRLSERRGAFKNWLGNLRQRPIDFIHREVIYPVLGRINKALRPASDTTSGVVREPIRMIGAGVPTVPEELPRDQYGFVNLFPDVNAQKPSVPDAAGIQTGTVIQIARPRSFALEENIKVTCLDKTPQVNNEGIRFERVAAANEYRLVDRRITAGLPGRVIGMLKLDTQSGRLSFWPTAAGGALEFANYDDVRYRVDVINNSEVHITPIQRFAERTAYRGRVAAGVAAIGDANGPRDTANLAFAQAGSRLTDSRDYVTQVKRALAWTPGTPAPAGLPPRLTTMLGDSGNLNEELRKATSSVERNELDLEHCKAAARVFSAAVEQGNDAKARLLGTDTMVGSDAWFGKRTNDRRAAESVEFNKGIITSSSHHMAQKFGNEAENQAIFEEQVDILSIGLAPSFNFPISTMLSEMAARRAAVDPLNTTRDEKFEDRWRDIPANRNKKVRFIYVGIDREDAEKASFTLPQLLEKKNDQLGILMDDIVEGGFAIRMGTQGRQFPYGILVVRDWNPPLTPPVKKTREDAVEDKLRRMRDLEENNAPGIGYWRDLLTSSALITNVFPQETSDKKDYQEQLEALNTMYSLRRGTVGPPHTPVPGSLLDANGFRREDVIDESFQDIRQLHNAFRIIERFRQGQGKLRLVKAATAHGTFPSQFGGEEGSRQYLELTFRNSKDKTFTIQLVQGAPYFAVVVDPNDQLRKGKELGLGYLMRKGDEKDTGDTGRSKGQALSPVPIDPEELFQLLSIQDEDVGKQTIEENKQRRNTW